MEVDWTLLPLDMLETISKKLTIYSDYIYARAVCTDWRSSIPKTPNHLPPQLPWLMLPQSQPHQSHRSFLNLCTGKQHLLNVPEASRLKRHCGSSHGWLIILDETLTILLFNPLMRGKILLPPLVTFPNVLGFNYSEIGREYTLSSPLGGHYNLNLREMRDFFIKKVVLSSSPVKDSDFIAVAILNQTDDLAYYRNGSQRWTIIEDAQSYSEDVIYRKGLFYAVDKDGSIAVCDVSGKTPRVSFIQTPRQSGGDMQYLVSSGDELLLVTRYLGYRFAFEPHQQHLIYRTIRFAVLRLNWSKPAWEGVRSLGDTALFIGENSSLALVASDFPGCVGDCVYFTDECLETNYEDVYGEHDLGIFKLWDGSTELLLCYPSDLRQRSKWPPPLWVTPNPS